MLPCFKKSTGRDQQPQKAHKVYLIICMLFACDISLDTTEPKMDKFQDIYYQANHLWKRQKAIRKLKELSKKKPKVLK